MEQEISNKLLKFKISDRDGLGVDLSNEDIAPSLKDCQLSLIAQVFGDKKANFNGVKIGKRIGNRLDVQIHEPGSQQGQVMKVLVELNVNEPILTGSFIRVGPESTWVDFRYENLQTFFFYCGCIGHDKKNCALRSEGVNSNVSNKRQYGDWLRATPLFSSENKSQASSNQGNQSSGKEPSANPNQNRSQIGAEWSGKQNDSLSQGKMLIRGEGCNQPESGGNTKIPVQESITSSSLEAQPMASPLKVVEPLSDDQLVDVAIQPSTIGARIVHRKKATFTRKSRPSFVPSSESTHIDVSEGVLNLVGDKGKRKRGSEALVSNNLPLEEVGSKEKKK
ncbi:Unknown protein [Striga hermonthica]|uniref:Zinc knuckle CX2CX4HX4C domain-containing protein n=1 Tax=Striga hermonthica TaxID=68872 RepID=A0A9N7RJQ5_STRHE|nr:Unknown protein [Striga hermonthica]